MKLQRIHDMNLVDGILNHPLVAPSLTDSEDWNVMVDHPSIHYLLVLSDENEVLGLYVLIPFNSVTLSVHSAFLPEGYGYGTKKAGELCKEYIFDTLQMQKLITQVPAYNIHAKGYAQRQGLKMEGTLVKAYSHHDKLYDIYLFGLTREEYQCQQ